MDVATRAMRRVGPAGDWFDEDPSWSPDGSRLAFMSTRGGGNNQDIYIMNADGTGVTRLTDHRANDQDPTWAADGQSLYFTSERNGRGEIFQLWIDSRKVDRITSGLSRAIMPAVSPDGRYLAYAAQLLIGFKVQLLNLQTGETTNVGAGDSCRPAFAPDSGELAFVHLADEPSELRAVTLKGSRTLVADPKMWVYYPAYSPDGNYVAFSVSPEHHRGEDWDLAIVDARNPGAYSRLTSGKGNDRVPEWRPAK